MFNYYHVDQILGAPETLWDFLGKSFPILTLVIGIYLNRWIAKSDKRRKDAKSFNDLVTEVELLEEPVRKQSESVRTLIENLEEKQFITPKFSSVLQLNLNRISLLDRLGIVDHLQMVSGSRLIAIKRANALFLGCDGITIRYQQLQEIVNDYVSTSGSQFEQWRAHANEQLRVISTLMVEVERDGRNWADDPLISGAIELTKDCLTMDADVLEIKEKVHNPLMHLYAKYRADLRTPELARLNSLALHSIMAIERERFYARSKLEQVRNKLVLQFNRLLTEARRPPSN